MIIWQNNQQKDNQFIMMNAQTVVYSDLVPHTLCCCKYWLMHQMCINPQLIIAPYEYNICSCLTNICEELQCQAVEGNYWATEKTYL